MPLSTRLKADKGLTKKNIRGKAIISLICGYNTKDINKIVCNQFLVYSGKELSSCSGKAEERAAMWKIEEVWAAEAC
jgi:hypothetical protein